MQAGPAWGAQLTVTENTQDTLARLRSALARGSSWAFDLLLVDFRDDLLRLRALKKALLAFL